MVHFIFFFAIDGDRFWWRRRESIDFITLIRGEAINMEDIVNFQGRWQSKFVVNIIFNFNDFKWSQLLWAKLC